MKKLIIAGLAIVLLSIGYIFLKPATQDSSPDKLTTASTNNNQDQTPVDDENENPENLSTNVSTIRPEAQEETEEEIKSAIEVYTSAAAALEAVKNGAKNYDDIILEQFVEPSSKCSWCGEFYDGVGNLLNSGDLSDDERAYFSEILAISGRIENIKTLVSLINDPKSQDKVEVYSEALELASGNKEMVSYLGELMSSENQVLRDSAVAAVTNHGDRQAIELLYKRTLESKDPDGFYSLGIGLGEVVPDQDSIPYLVEIANKKDQYSHLAIKSLMNQGNEGLRRVLEILDTSSNPEAEAKMLEGASDHFALEDGSQDILKSYLPKATNEVQKKFISQLLEEFNAAEDEEEPAGEELQSEVQE